MPSKSKVGTIQRKPRETYLLRAGVTFAAFFLTWPVTAVADARPPSLVALYRSDPTTRTTTSDAASPSLVSPNISLAALEPVGKTLPPTPHLRLKEPEHNVTVFERRRNFVPTLHVDTPDYWLPTDVPPKSTPPRTGQTPSTFWEYPTDPIYPPVVPPGGNQPNPAFTLLDRSARPSPTDDRSAWARWNSDLWGVSTTIGTFMVTMVAGFTLLPRNVTGWDQPEFNGLKGNFTSGPRFDNDRFYFNYVAHPIDGSEFYLAARNRNLNWWQSLAYSAAVSATFEYFIESAYERASWQDLWITPVSGAVLGELRWQAKKALENPSTGKPIGTKNKILYVIIDPLDAVYKL